MSKLGLVLSGGSIRGVAHIGMLKVLEEYGLLDDIRVVVGTSAGSIVGAMYAFGYTPDQMKQIWFEDVWRLLGGKKPSAVEDWNISGLLDALIHFDLKRFRGALKGDKLLKALECYLTEDAPCTTIRPAGTRRPLYIISTDSNTQQETVWCFTRHIARPDMALEAARSRWELQPAPGRRAFWEVHLDYDQDVLHFPSLPHVCRCSASIPFVFVPARAPITYKGSDTGVTEVTIDNLYTDGGVRDNYSLSVAVKLAECDRVIGMFLSSLDVTDKPWNGLLDLAMRTLDEEAMTIFEADQDDGQLRQTDIRTLVPHFARPVSTFDVKAIKPLYKAGYTVTRHFLEAVQETTGQQTLTWDLIFNTTNLTSLPAGAELYGARTRAKRLDTAADAQPTSDVKYYIYREVTDGATP